MLTTTLVAIALATAPLTVAPSAVGVDAEYVITELGTLRAGGYGLATAVNNSGQVAGYTETGQTERVNGTLYYIYHAFRWDPTTPNGTTGVLKDLGSGNGKWSYANDINDAGHVVGWTGGNPGANYYTPKKYAFVHNGQTMKTLPMPSGQSWSVAYGINSLGQVAGEASKDYYPHVYAIRWDTIGAHDLGGFGGNRHVAYGITDSGRAYGVSDNRAFLTAPNSLINLSTDDLLGMRSIALGSNALDHIVGFYTDPSFLEHAFVIKDGAVVNLGPPLPGNTQTRASAINHDGVIVGRTFWSEIIYSSRFDHNTAVIWRDGKLIDLNTLVPRDSGWHLLWARDINNAGQIVCEARNADLEHMNLLLTPTALSGPAGPALSSLALSPSSVEGGAPATGTVTLTKAAPSGGFAVSLASSDTGVATVPASVTVSGGAQSATFTVTTKGVTSNKSVTISANASGVTRNAVLTVTAPATDTVTISKAEYRVSNGNLAVNASSTKSNVSLNVYVSSTGAWIGTLASQGGGKFRGSFTLASNPVTIRVDSSGGGSATKAVTLR